jgi:hypothetical protein
MLQELGKYNIICVEDLIHEIYTVSPLTPDLTGGNDLRSIGFVGTVGEPLYAIAALDRVVECDGSTHSGFP